MFREMEKEYIIDNIRRVFAEHGIHHNIYIYGGFVRFLIDDQEYDDIDIYIPASLYMNIERYIKNIIIKLENKIHKEININILIKTILGRKIDNPCMVLLVPDETGYNHPYALDFTASAVGYDVFKDHIIDFFNGVYDIRKRILRTIYNPYEILTHDPIRVLRMCYYIYRYNYRATDDLLSSARSLYKYSVFRRELNRYVENKYICVNKYLAFYKKCLKEILNGDDI